MERSPSSTVEHAPFDRRALKHGSLVGTEPVEPRREQRLDRRRDDNLLCGVLGLHGEHLLDEERIAFGCFDDPRSRRVAQLVRLDQSVDENLSLDARKWTQGDGCRVRARRGPRRAGIEEIGPGQAKEQDWSAAGEADQVLEQVEQCRLCPVDIVGDDEQRAPPREGLEEFPERPRGFLGRAGARTVECSDCPCDARDDERRPVALRQQLCKALLRVGAGDLANDLCERPVGYAIAIREAPSNDDTRLVGDQGDEFSGQTRLAYPRRADDRRERARAIAHGRLERLLENAELLGAAHEWRGDRSRERGNVREIGRAHV